MEVNALKAINRSASRSTTNITKENHRNLGNILTSRGGPTLNKGVGQKVKNIL